MQKYQKNFDDWNQVKKTIQQPGKRQFVREGEVRWAMIGVNVGTEIDGKGVNYARPVLVAAVDVVLADCPKLVPIALLL